VREDAVAHERNYVFEALAQLPPVCGLDVVGECPQMVEVCMQLRVVGPDERGRVCDLLGLSWPVDAGGGRGRWC
jgi:hypothetical protein